MATYTGVADANGDFIVPFLASYTSGQKVTVTSEKEGATKTIELFAPSDVSGGGKIRFSGTMVNFPTNVGSVEIVDLSGAINPYAFDGENGGFPRLATSLTINGGDINVGNYTFRSWRNTLTFTVNAVVKALGQWSFSYMEKVTNVDVFNTILASVTATTIPISCFFGNKAVTGHLVIPDHIVTIDTQAFASWNALTKLTIGSSVKNLNIQCFSGLLACNEIICLPLVPPVYGNGVLVNLKASCVIKVPSGSLSAYQTATGWSAFASQMVGV
ncbi:leucine-rich repeat protein [Acinetobacter sp. YH12145]|uniref:leucine-rich repeat protein n=1 Tax=Acinetobacter sp. YH12145 TaxID=2601129 RepID=UPI0015D0D1C0|nr:leucine-rich repeat protein [Acinetobacter sp. YH12145]